MYVARADDDDDDDDDRMEEHLQKLVQHAEPKRTYSIVVTDRSSRIQTRFSPPLVFSKNTSCYYEMALCKLETYYSFPNIDATNNCIKVRAGDKAGWKTLTIPTGCYEITAINEEMQRLIVQLGGKKDKVVLSANNSTLRCVLEVKDDKYEVDFRGDHSLRTVLGFDGKLYKRGRFESEQLVDIMSVNSIMVHCDIIGGTRVNGVEAPVIYNFFPDTAPGDKIICTPKNLIYVPITMDVISHMTCWLTDQSGKELDLRGEKLTITFHMKACGS